MNETMPTREQVERNRKGCFVSAVQLQAAYQEACDDLLKLLDRVEQLEREKSELLENERVMRIGLVNIRLELNAPKRTMNWSESRGNDGL